MVVIAVIIAVGSSSLGSARSAGGEGVQVEVAVHKGQSVDEELHQRVAHGFLRGRHGQQPHPALERRAAKIKPALLQCICMYIHRVVGGVIG